MGAFKPPNAHPLSWADNNTQPESSGSMEGENTDRFENGNGGEISKSSDQYDQGLRITDSKVLRRLAQNREAARKSRLRKKAYVQQLESSRVKLNQLEQELERARQQGMYVSGHLVSGESAKPVSSGVAAFNMDHARWVEEQNRQLMELRTALANKMADKDLKILVENGLAHYDELFRLKGIAVKVDVFHIISGMWRTHAERCFMWMGGFRPSELLKIFIPQLEPLTESQVVALCNLQQSSQQAEDALSQGMEALQQNLGDTLATGANYMGQMSLAMGKLSTLESFVHQADNLRQQSLQQMHRVLTTHQAARGLLVMGEYYSRLRALSSLWIARPHFD